MVQMRADSGRKVDLTEEEYSALRGSISRAKSKERRQEILRQSLREYVVFRAEGRAYPKLEEGSKFPTASNFYSNKILGRAVFPPSYTLEQLHKSLSRALNDRHIKTRQIGEWRLTHSSGKPQNGGWTMRFQRVIQIKTAAGTRQEILEDIAEES